MQRPPVYDRRLSIAEVLLRIERYWRPYHDALRAELDATHRRYGALWHLNVHAMTDDSDALLELPDQPLADFVLGDLDGASADEATLSTIEDALRSHGALTLCLLATHPGLRLVAVTMAQARPGARADAGHRRAGSAAPRLPRAIWQRARRLIGGLIRRSRRPRTRPGRRPASGRRCR